jgi:hypothetical protein
VCLTSAPVASLGAGPVAARRALRWGALQEIGNIRGTRSLDPSEDGTPVALQVEADGDWTVTIVDMDTMPQLAASAHGTGSAILIIPAGTNSGLTTYHITHAGRSNFVVHAYGSRSALVVNAIGHYDGEQVISSEAVVIEIEADGAWTMTKT